MTLYVVKNPINEAEDLVIHFSMQKIQLILNPHFINRLSNLVELFYA